MITIDFLDASGAVIEKYDHRIHSGGCDVSSEEWAIRFAYGMFFNNARQPELTGIFRVRVIDDLENKTQEMTYSEFHRRATIC